MKTLIAGLFLLNFVTALHELGHLLVARWAGVKVRRYSLRFGKVLFSRKIGETEYCLSLLPLGGYVKLAGHGESDKEYKNDPPESLYFSKPVLKRMAIVAAGPVTNYILALSIFIGLNFFVGTPVATSRVMQVVDNSAAMHAGIQKGDLILDINGNAVKTWEEAVSALHSVSDGADLNFLIDRNGEHLHIKLGLKSGPSGIIGGEFIYENPHRFEASVKKGFSFLYYLNKESLKGFKNLLTGKMKAKDGLAGPVAIVSLSGQMLRIGFYTYILWIGIVSFAVGLMNFLPIPVVDGGYLALMVLEIIRGKPLEKETENKILGFGMCIMISLALWSFYFDVMRLLNK